MIRRLLHAINDDTDPTLMETATNLVSNSLDKCFNEYPIENILILKANKDQLKEETKEKED